MKGLSKLFRAANKLFDALGNDRHLRMAGLGALVSGVAAGLAKPEGEVKSVKYQDPLINELHYEGVSIGQKVGKGALKDIERAAFSSHTDIEQNHSRFKTKREDE